MRPLYTMRRGEPLTPERLENYIQLHRKSLDEYAALWDAYTNNAPIFHLRPKALGKPDNRLGASLARYLVDSFNGFFIGVPIKTTHPNETVARYLEEIQRRNDQDDNNAELSRLCSVFGHAFELVYVDENADVGLTYLDPREAFVIYDDSVRRVPLFGVRYRRDKDGGTVGSVSDASRVYYFRTGAQGLVIDEGTPHNFNGVPLIEYFENEDRLGVFETQLSLINSYNKLLSEKANDVDYYADAYMKILGAPLDEETIKSLRDNRIINLSGFDSDKIVVEFLSKPEADRTQENLLDRLEKLIYRLSMIADINDDTFGTASGVSLKYKLQGMSNLAAVKERKFTSGMNQRYKLIASLPNSPMSADDWAGIEYRFTRNLPANEAEEATIAAQLTGILSEETQLKILSCVDDVGTEIKRKEAEAERANAYEFPEVEA